MLLGGPEQDAEREASADHDLLDVEDLHGVLRESRGQGRGDAGPVVPGEGHEQRERGVVVRCSHGAASLPSVGPAAGPRLDLRRVRRAQGVPRRATQRAQRLAPGGRLGRGDGRAVALQREGEHPEQARRGEHGAQRALAGAWAAAEGCAADGRRPRRAGATSSRPRATSRSSSGRGRRRHRLGEPALRLRQRRQPGRRHRARHLEQVPAHHDAGGAAPTPSAPAPRTAPPTGPTVSTASFAATARAVTSGGPGSPMTSPASGSTRRSPVTPAARRRPSAIDRGTGSSSPGTPTTRCRRVVPDGVHVGLVEAGPAVEVGVAPAPSEHRLGGTQPPRHPRARTGRRYCSAGERRAAVPRRRRRPRRHGDRLRRQLGRRRGRALGGARPQRRRQDHACWRWPPRSSTPPAARSRCSTRCSVAPTSSSCGRASASPAPRSPSASRPTSACRTSW